MLGWRLFLSAMMVPAFVVGFYFDARLGTPAPILLLVAVLLAGRAAWELADLLTVRSIHVNSLVVMGSSVLIVAANWVGRLTPTVEVPASELQAIGPAMLVFSGSVLFIFLLAAMRFHQPGSSMESLGAELLVVCYVGVLLSLTAQLRWVGGADVGYLALGSLIIATKAGDIGAYSLGRLFGKRKLIPRLSPGKTWAGAYGAVLGAGAASWAWFTWGTPLLVSDGKPCSAPWSILFGVIIGIVGLVGDLCESLIKRDVGRKDSAELLPGFGGVLDILDSILFAGPVAYFLWLVLPLNLQ